MRGGVLLRFFASRVRLAYAVGVALFLWSVAQFFRPDTGFTSLISIGDLLNESKVTALRQVPHYVYEASPGYDGAYYAQLALHPTLDNPELTRAIDNLPYRAKRILFCWVAWALGLGQPAWILQAHALLNVVCWLALGWLLLRWFPADSWENFFRWAGVMFSHGLCMSVRHSLVDGPALLLVALAMRWLEEGRGRAGAVTLALAGLGKETSLLAVAGLGPARRETGNRRPETGDHQSEATNQPEKVQDPTSPVSGFRFPVSGLGSLVFSVMLIALPLFAWMGYVRWKFGPAEDPGMGNFTLPFAGYVEKMAAIGRDVTGAEAASIYWATFATVVAIGVQWVFFAVRWRPAERWWRVGIAFAVMLVFLSTPVWEGYPGAFTRVLLPMTLAFNVLVPRGLRWWPLLLAGNLTVATSVFEFSPPHEFFELSGDREARQAVRVVPRGWHGPERHLDNHWRWSAGGGELRVSNEGGAPVAVVVRGQVSSTGESRRVRVSIGERMLWSEEIVGSGRALRFGFTAPPGETVLTFSTDRPADKVGTDPRELAFQVANLEIVVRAAAVPP